MAIGDILKTMISRSWLGSVAGLQMMGKRNLYETFGWNVNPTHQNFLQKYRRQDITRRVINAPVNALWSDPPVISGDDAFNKAWSDLLASQKVFFNLQRLDKMAGLGAFAIMVVGLDDGASLDKPVTYKAGRKVIYFQPYMEGSVTVETFETNSNSPRFGLPTMYSVNPGLFDQSNPSIKKTNAIPSFKVHWTRVLHVAENIMESEVYGSSNLEPIYNVLDDILKVTGGSAELYWLSANRGLHINVDKEMEMDADDAKALEEEVDEYSNNLRRVIRTRGVDVKSLGAEGTDPRGTFDVQLSLLASSTGIPKRVLSGSEAGQLASQQDRANWSQRVAERITEYGQPIVLLPFIRLLIDIGVLPKPSQLSIEWPDAFKMNPLERAQTSAQMARSAANLSRTLKTVADINQQNAENSRPSIVSGGGGGFFGNASPSMADPKAKSQPDTIEQPALFPKEPPKLVLLTEDECRSIIGFGKHMPVFDEKSDAQTHYTANPKDPSTIDSGEE